MDHEDCQASAHGLGSLFGHVSGQRTVCFQALAAGGLADGEADSLLGQGAAELAALEAQRRCSWSCLLVGSRPHTACLPQRAYQPEPLGSSFCHLQWQAGHFFWTSRQLLFSCPRVLAGVLNPVSVISPSSLTLSPLVPVSLESSPMPLPVPARTGTC